MRISTLQVALTEHFTNLGLLVIAPSGEVVIPALVISSWACEGLSAFMEEMSDNNLHGAGLSFAAMLSIAAMALTTGAAAYFFFGIT